MNEYQTWTSWVGVLPWWYTIVPSKLARHQKLLFFTVADYFSFEILLKTLFQPWKRDELSAERLSLSERVQIWGLNLVSRFFGFLMRSAAILVGLISLAIVAVFLIFLWLSWVLAPFIGVGLIAVGVLTILGGLR